MAAPRRRRVLRLLAVPAALAAVTVGLLSVSEASAGQRHVMVTLVRGADRRTLPVDPPATVGGVLSAARVTPTAGRLLSVGTGRVLDEGNARPQLWLGGALVEPSAPVRDGDVLRLVEAPDEVESTIDVDGNVPPPPLPEVINELWRPGLPGRGRVARGIRSGEEITRSTVTAPIPPARMTDKEIALTFDDGPWPTTPQVLQILRDKQVKAMFCMVGYTLNADGVARAKQALADGHSLCNHTVHHDERLPKKPQAVVDAEINGGNEMLTSRLGVPRPVFYRPPGGSLGPNIVATAKGQGQTVLMWTIDPADYRKPPAGQIIERVMSRLRPGAIILLHDGGGDRSQTVAALPAIIDQARAQGYTFVTPDKVAPVPNPAVAQPPAAPPPPAPIPAPLEPGG